MADGFYSCHFFGSEIAGAHPSLPKVHENLLLGFSTGTLTALLTNPLDVIKTRIIGVPSEVMAPGGKRREPLNDLMWLKNIVQKS